MAAHTLHSTVAGVGQQPIVQGRGASAQQEPINSLSDYNPELTGAAGAAEQVTHKFFMADMAMMMGGGVLGGVAKVVGAPKNIEFLNIGKPFKWISDKIDGLKNVVTAPREFALHTETGDALGKAAEGLQKGVAKVSEGAAAHMGSFVQGATEAQSAIGAGVEKSFDVASQGVGKIVESSQTLQDMFAFAAKHRNDALTEAHGKLTGAARDTSLTGVRGWWNAKRNPNIGAELSDAVSELQAYKIKHADAATAGTIDTFTQAHEKLTEHLKDVKNLGSGETEQLVKNAQTALKDMETLRGSGVVELDGSIARVNKAFAAVSTQAEKLATRAATVSFLENPAAAVKAMPAVMAKTNLHHMALNTAMAGASIFNVAHTAVSFEHDLETLKKMVAATENTIPKDVSTVHALMGDTRSNAVKEARSAFIKQYAVEGAMDAVDIGLNVAMMRKNGLPMAVAMPAFAATSLVPMMMRDKNTMTAFDGLDRALASGAPVGAGAYAEFIQAAVPEARNVDAANGLLVELASHYAKTQVKPDQLLRDIESGAMKKLASDLQQKMATEGREAGALVGEKHAPEIDDRTKNNLLQAGAAASLAMGASEKPAKEVLGKHTAHLVAAEKPAHLATVHKITEHLQPISSHAPHIPLNKIAGAVHHDGVVQQLGQELGA